MSAPPDPADPALHIPVRVVNGRLTYLHGNKLPPLREGATGALIVPEHAVTDPAWRAALKAERSLEILPASERLLLAVRTQLVPPHHADRLVPRDPDHVRNAFAPLVPEPALKLPLPPIDDFVPGPLQFENDSFVEVHLADPLRLMLRGGKRAGLRPARCHIPALGCDAASLNHAYSLISAALEPDRRSHTGNVFERARHFADSHWRPLETLRAEKEAEFERQLIAEGRRRARPPAPSVHAGFEVAGERDNTHRAVIPRACRLRKE